MRYTKFIIKNFKGIKELTLDLNKLPQTNLYTLVGLNESGKTTILEAIAQFSKKYLDKNPHEFIPKSLKGNFNDSVSVLMELELDENDERRIADFCKEHNFYLTSKIQKTTVEKIYKFSNSEFTNNKPHTFWTLPLFGTTKRGKKEFRLYEKDKDKWNKVVNFIGDNFPKIILYKDFLFNFPKKFYIKHFTEDENNNRILEDLDFLDNDWQYYMIFEDMLNSLGDGITIEDHIVKRLEANTEESIEALEMLISKINKKLTEKIFGRWDEIFATDANQKGNKEIMIKCKPDDEGYFIEMKIKENSNIFNINERSLGFRWFFSFLLFTEFRKSRKNEFGETLFLLDEPANNLHPKAQLKLLETFQKLTEDCKLIYSTHNQYLINPNFFAGTYIVANSATDYSSIDSTLNEDTNITVQLYKNFVSSHPNETDHYKPILDAIDFTLSHLEFKNKIIFLEGKNDYYLFNYVNNVYFNKKYKLNFFPGAGVDKYDETLRYALALNYKFIALFDDDNAGKKAKRKYIDHISIELEEKIFTYRDINTYFNGFTAEKFFSDEEKELFVTKTFDEQKAINKSSLNTAIQNAFINTIKIELSENTLDNFKRIFEFLKKR